MGAGAEENPFIMWRRGQYPTPPMIAVEAEGEVSTGDDFRDRAGEAALTDIEGRVAESLANAADGVVNHEGPSNTYYPEGQN